MDERYLLLGRFVHKIEILIMKKIKIAEFNHFFDNLMGLFLVHWNFFSKSLFKLFYMCIFEET